MNYENSRPVGATVLPEAGGRTKPENGECNIWMTFEQLEKTWRKRGKSRLADRQAANSDRR